MELVATEDTVRRVLIIARATTGTVRTRLSDGRTGVEAQIGVALGLRHRERGNCGETREQRGNENLLLDEHGGPFKICEIASKGYAAALSADVTELNCGGKNLIC